MIAAGRPSSMERPPAPETLAAALRPPSAKAIKKRLERILIDDRELLISTQCQLEQIRRARRSPNDEGIVRAPDGVDPQIRH